MVTFKRSIVSVVKVCLLAILVIALLFVVKTSDRSQAPANPLPLGRSPSYGTTTDSTETVTRKETEQFIDHGASEVPAPFARRQLTQRDIDGVRYFVLFIGYAHSGHSIIGSMMDAHPNMVIAHEYGVMNGWSNNRKRLSDKKTLFNELCNESRSVLAPNGWYNYKGKGYTLAIPDLWQGCQFTDLKVIGDKRGGYFTASVASNSRMTRRMFDEVKTTVGVPIKLIHVVRNPFDIIATTVAKAEVVGQHRWENDSMAQITRISPNEISLMKKRANAIIAVEKEWGADMLEIHHVDFIHNPKAVLQKICDFVDVDCPKVYLETCYNKTFTKVSKSRYLVKWPSDVIAEGEAMMKEIPFFKRYSFDSE